MFHFFGPLPITERRRREHFDLKAVLPSKHHAQRLVPRKALIQSMANRTTGINPKIGRRAIKGMPKLRAMLSRKGKSEKSILLAQAMLLDNLACENADHFIESMKRKEMLPTFAQQLGVKTEGMSMLQIEEQAWTKSFQRFFLDFQKKSPDAYEILTVLKWSHDYLSVPAKVHEQRQKYWRTISKIEKKLLSKEINPEKNLAAEIKRILQRTFGLNKTTSIKKLNHLKAMDIIVAASIYADIMLETKGKQITDIKQKQDFWEFSYSEAMEKTYPLIENSEGIVQEIIDFRTQSIRQPGE
jgi:hypothetical protein